MDEEILKEELKKDLISYFDSIRSEVDVRGQILLYELGTDKQESSIKFNKTIITDINKKMVEKINLKLNESINDLNDFFNKNYKILDMNIDQIKLKAFQNDCIYFGYEELIKTKRLPHRLRYDRLDKYKMGLLICFDWYLDENLVNFIE